MFQRTQRVFLMAISLSSLRVGMASCVGLLAVLFTSVSAWAGPCDVLSDLEKSAALGKLAPEVTACLVGLRDAGEPTRSSQASSLLIANAFASQDPESWARHVKTHLESVDNSDCELMMKYGVHLLRADAPEEALTWIDAAAAHSFGWSAKVLEAKLFELRRLKTRALWAMYDQLGEDAGLKKRAALGKVQLAAIEWMRAGAKGERDISDALGYCIKTGWTAERCEQQAAIQAR